MIQIHDVGHSSLYSKEHKCASTICPQYCICAWSLWSANAPIIAAIPPVFATLVKLLKGGPTGSTSEVSTRSNHCILLHWSCRCCACVPAASANLGSHSILDSWSKNMFHTLRLLLKDNSTNVRKTSTVHAKIWANNISAGIRFLVSLFVFLW